MNAWLLTWEGTTSNIVPNNKIAAIVSARRSDAFIQELVQVLFCRTTDAAYDAVQLINKPKQRRADLTMLCSQPGRIFFGRNPFIFARRVSKLNVVRDEEQGIETVSWIEPPYFRVEGAGEMPVIAEPEQPRTLVREVHSPLSKELR